jgi:S1-C subfamily serine protease
MRIRIPFPLLIAAILAPAIAAAQPPTKGTSKPKAAAAEQPADESIPDIRNSVVKVFSTFRQPDMRRPWTKQPPSDATGTGVCIAGKRILTNAHMVTYASRVLVQPNESSDKLDAEIVAVAPGIDLALLKLKDESYFDSHPAATLLEELPKVGDKVKAVGYPKGGDSLSITEGIVSRIEYTEYNLETMGLRIQVDAALNPGNSGGPAVSVATGKIVGLVFSGIPDADNIGYIIPVEEIHAFLEDVKDGRLDGRQQIRESMQTFENPALREKLGVAKDVQGMIITRPSSDASDWPLKKWDIITAIGDHKVDDTGMTQVAENLRLNFAYYAPKLCKDGKVPLSIVRDGKPMNIELPVSSDSNRLLPHLGTSYPSYFIYGPLVFTPVYAEHLRLNSTVLSFRGSPILTKGFSKRTDPDEQLVTVCSPLFPHRITKGYDVDYFPCVAKVNGTKIKNIRHLIETLRDCKDEFVIFEWYDQHVENLVFKRSDILATTDEILDDNGIRNRASPDLAEIWPAK